MQVVGGECPVYTAANPSGKIQKSLGSDPDSATHRQGGTGHFTFPELLSSCVPQEQKYLLL